MGYCTVDDIKKHIEEDQLIQLTDPENLVIDETIITNQIDDAGVTIDAMIATIYPVPFTTVPAIINNICRDIAIYAIFRRRFSDKMPEAVVADYHQSLQLLEDFATSKKVIPSLSQTYTLKPRLSKEQPCRVYDDEFDEYYKKTRDYVYLSNSGVL